MHCSITFMSYNIYGPSALGSYYDNHMKSFQYPSQILAQ